jgi:hypothetical protein
MISMLTAAMAAPLRAITEAVEGTPTESSTRGSK